VPTELYEKDLHKRGHWALATSLYASEEVRRNLARRFPRIRPGVSASGSSVTGTKKRLKGVENEKPLPFHSIRKFPDPVGETLSEPQGVLETLMEGQPRKSA